MGMPRYQNNRDLIAIELRRRLMLVADTLNIKTIVEGDGGIWGSWGKTLPCIHIYELQQEVVKVKPGVYDITFPIQIEFVTKLQNRSSLYSEGREKLKQLQAAIELDEEFCKDNDNQNKLVYNYGQIGNEITEVLNQVIDVGMVYNFKYVDKFLGYPF